MRVYCNSSVREEGYESPSQRSCDNRNVHVTWGPKMAEVECLEVDVVEDKHELANPEA